jgi:hypothetical protein
MRRGLTYLALVLAALLPCFPRSRADAPKNAAPPRFALPPGFVIEKVAGPPLVRYPLFACFDDRGWLFVAEGTGTKLPGAQVDQMTPSKVPLMPEGLEKTMTRQALSDLLEFSYRQR